MTNRPTLARPCSAVLESTLRPAVKVSGNDSSSVWECMTWGYQGDPRNIQCAHNEGVAYHLSQSAQLEPNRNLLSKCGCCEDGEYIETSAGEYYSDREHNTGVRQQDYGQTQAGKQQGGKINLKGYV